MKHHTQFQTHLSNANQIISDQITKLKILSKKFEIMNSDFRKQIIKNIKVGNNARAKVLANELANIHRIQHTTRNIGISLEVVVLRSTIINELAMIMDTINPTIELIKDIEKDISKIIPTANEVLNDVEKTTSEVLNYNINHDAKISTFMDEDALKILNDVEQTVEKETKLKLPSIPPTIKTIKDSSESESLLQENDVII